MEKFKGIIALDIDGTITADAAAIDEKVIDYLETLIQAGWHLVFMTGRTFSFAKPVFSSFKGTFFLTVQNGAALYKMPEESCCKKISLPFSLVARLTPLFEKEPFGLLIESGKENSDICYYRPSDFSKENLNYLNYRMTLAPEFWQAVDSIENLALQNFAVGKYFALEKKALDLAKKIEQIDKLTVTVIRDPFRPDFSLAIIHSKEASKGKMLLEFKKEHGWGLPVIGAGDDYNDLEMLEKSDIKIMMENSPPELHRVADILAPPVNELGIIKGLKEAVWKVLSK